MQLTEEVHVVAVIVRRALSTRTDWVLEGEHLMAEIEANVKAHEPSGPPSAP
jgi:hypothetical protein